MHFDLEILLSGIYSKKTIIKIYKDEWKRRSIADFPVKVKNGNRPNVMNGELQCGASIERRAVSNQANKAETS